MLTYKRKIVLGSLAISSAVALISIVAVYRLHLDAFINGLILSIIGVHGFFFLCLIWYLSNPIQKIVDAVMKYHAGEKLFRIFIDPSQRTDEMTHLAATFNSLSEEAQKGAIQAMIQKKEMESILESLSEGVLACDTKAKVTFASTMACLMLGIQKEEIIGKSFEELVQVKQLTDKNMYSLCHDVLLESLQTFEPVHENWKATTNPALYFHLAAVPRGHRAGAILVLQDKTSDYKMLQMGKDFIGNASHELKTPLTIIRGFAETLQDHPNLPKETIAEIMEKIIRTCGRLDNLVRSLLILSDLENLHQDNGQMISVSDLISQCISLMLEAHPEAHIERDIEDENILIFGDPSLLEVAIRNLLENGIRYSQAPAHLKIKIEQTKETVFIRIADAGIGIPMSDLPYIFDRFYTVDKARSRKSGGAGLGLSIAKTIVEKHQGAISAVSTVGKGSEFTITLPNTNPGK